MASFGSGAGVSRSRRCRQFMLFCSLLLTLIAQRQARAQSIASRVYKVATDDNVRLDLNNDYYEFVGRNISIFCYCRDDSNGMVRYTQLRHSGTIIKTNANCTRVIYDLRITSSDEGRYECVLDLRDGSFSRKSAGILHAIDPNIIQAPRVQFGLLNRPITLSCTVNSTDVSTIWTTPANNTRNGQFSIDNVGLEHDGKYTCLVIISDMNLRMNKSILFTVIVPPTLHSPPNQIVTFYSNTRQNLTVQFQSETINHTHISWYKDGTTIQDSDPERHDQLIRHQRSTTELIFNPIRRSNGGEYRVVMENSHEIIPSHLQTIDALFTVKVCIVPATPTGLSTRNVSDLRATLRWSLQSEHGDDAAEDQIIRLYNGDDSEAEYEERVGGDVRELNLPLIPAQQYRVQVVAYNQDGNTTSAAHEFQSRFGAPLLTGVEVRRSEERNNTLKLTATLRYTGGGTITHFVISFHVTEMSLWIPLKTNFTAVAINNSQLTWSTEVTDERFHNAAIELQVMVVNGDSYVSNVINISELIVLPGAPTMVQTISSDYESVVLRLELSSTGTAPLTHVEVEFHSPNPAFLNLTHPNLYPGATVDLTLSNLDDATTYNVTLAVYNNGGKGQVTPRIQVTTAERPPLGVVGIALVAASGVVLLVILVILIVVICKLYTNKQRKQREYSVAQAENHKFPVNNDIVKTGKISPLSPTSPTPPTPSTATSILTQTPRPSPPGLYNHAPPYCSSSVPYLPRGPASGLPPTSSSSSSSSHAPPPTTFKFDTGSSRSNSVQESDFSESNSPRYTYTFPRSVEGTPQIGRAYDQVDLPLEQAPPTRLESGRGREKMMVQAHHVSHEPIRFGECRGRPGSATTHHKVGGYGDIDSPQLRTQSSHSVATTQTRLTSSDSMSTSISYPHIETNTTDV